MWVEGEHRNPNHERIRICVCEGKCVCVCVWHSTKIDGNLNWAFRYKYARVLLCFAAGPPETNTPPPDLSPSPSLLHYFLWITWCWGEGRGGGGLWFGSVTKGFLTWGVAPHYVCASALILTVSKSAKCCRQSVSYICMYVHTYARPSSIPHHPSLHATIPLSFPHNTTVSLAQCTVAKRNRPKTTIIRNFNDLTCCKLFHRRAIYWTI